MHTNEQQKEGGGAPKSHCRVHMLKKRNICRGLQNGQKRIWFFWGGGVGKCHLEALLNIPAHHACDKVMIKHSILVRFLLLYQHHLLASRKRDQPFWSTAFSVFRENQRLWHNLSPFLAHTNLPDYLFLYWRTVVILKVHVSAPRQTGCCLVVRGDIGLQI